MVGQSIWLEIRWFICKGTNWELTGLAKKTTSLPPTWRHAVLEIFRFGDGRCGMILPTNVLKSESCSFNLNNLSRTKASKETKQTNQLAASGRLSTPSSRKLQPHLRYVMFFTAWPPGDRGKQPFVGFPKGQKLRGRRRGNLISTVDGSENQLTCWGWWCIPLFTRFYTSQVVIAGFLKHQQYGSFWVWWYTMLVNRQTNCKPFVLMWNIVDPGCPLALHWTNLTRMLGEHLIILCIHLLKKIYTNTFHTDSVR